MRSSTVALIALTLVLGALPAAAQDFDVFAQLVERANAAHNLLESAPEHRQEALRETALEADMAVVDWLETFLAGAEYQALPDDQQMLVVRHRYRWEYNLAALLTGLDRCSEARDRIRSLLDRPMNDPELRPRLTEAYDSAIACLNRPRLALLRVEAEPADAQVYVDGVLAGLPGADIEVPLGSHELVVRADGYVSDTRTFEPTHEGELVAVGPVRLMLVQLEPDPSPTWYEWTLWSAGVVGVGVGILYFVQAGSRQSDVDSPPAGFAVADEPHEGEVIDDLQVVGYVTGGVGVACLIAGTISYFTRDKSRAAAPPRDTARIGLGVGQVFVGVPF